MFTWFIAYSKKKYRQAIKSFRGTVPNDKNFAQLTRFYAALAVSTHRALPRGLGAERAFKRLKPDGYAYDRAWISSTPLFVV